MMKSRRLTLLLIASIACLAVNTAFALDNGPETLTIDAAKYQDVIKKKPSKVVANFPHKKHQAEFLKGNEQFSHFKYTDDWTCKACHHPEEKGGQPEACFKCKDANKMLEKVGGKYDKLYHDTCRDGCHKAMEKAGKKTGPTKCAGCHGK